jgi:glycosyltransferase involved in cell wall biosynthesis
MISSRHKVIVVTPVYEDVQASSRLFRELVELFNDTVFVVAVDDGSITEPVQIEHLQKAGASGCVLRLRRNVGHQRAIAIGLSYVSEHMQQQHRVVVMDSDGEELPATILDLLAHLESEQIDVVVAKRKSRVETFRFKVFYALYKRLFRLMTGRSLGFGNFMALKYHAVKRLVAMQELSIHVAGAVLASKLRTAVCPLDRGPRYAGVSKMNFVGLALHGFKGLMVFAEDVLVRAGIVCAAVATLSIIGTIIAVILKITGFSTPGWFSIFLGILVLMFLQTGALALMMLMLTGIVRGVTIATAITYREFIDCVIKTD